MTDLQLEVANGADAQVVGNVAPHIALYLGNNNPAQVTVEDNRGSFIFLRRGYTASPTSVRRNLLDGGIVVEGATNLEMEGDQLGRPLVEATVEISGTNSRTFFMRVKSKNSKLAEQGGSP